jgi:ABC-type nitrate/sulfonate/bicarbonate transport system substrate-binding protein
LIRRTHLGKNLVPRMRLLASRGWYYALARPLFLICLSLGLAFAGAALVGAVVAFSAQPDQLRIAYSESTADLVPLWLAQDRRLFQKNGAGSPQLMKLTPAQAADRIIRGELDFYIGGSEGLWATLAGANLEYIATQTSCNCAVYAQPGLQSRNDMLGASLSMTRDDSNELALNTLLQHWGIARNEVDVSYAADYPTALDALIGGNDQAAVLRPPWSSVARLNGFHPLAASNQTPTLSIGTGVIVDWNWASQHSGAVRAFLRAYIEGIEVALTQPQAAEGELQRNFHLDSVQAAEAYKDAASQWAKYPAVSPDAIRNELDSLHDSRKELYQPSDFYDNSYLFDLSGFTQGLYCRVNWCNSL